MRRTRPQHARPSRLCSFVATHLQNRSGAAVRATGAPRPGAFRRVLLASSAVALAAGAIVVADASVTSASLNATVSVPTQSPNPIVPGQTATYTPITATRSSTPQLRLVERQRPSERRHLQ